MHSHDARMIFEPWTFPIVPARTALLIVDMQYLDAHRDYGRGVQAREAGLAGQYAYFFDEVENRVVPNIRRLLAVSRAVGVQPIYTRIASLVDDCRDVSLQNKRVALRAPAGSKEAEILDELRPLSNEIVVTKGASGAFGSTALDQILRNVGLDTLIVTGVVTNYCVESTVREAADRGYNVVLAEDACAAKSRRHQEFSIEIMKNIYCLVQATSALCDTLTAQRPAAVAVAG